MAYSAFDILRVIKTLSMQNLNWSLAGRCFSCTFSFLFLLFRWKVNTTFEAPPTAQHLILNVNLKKFNIKGLLLNFNRCAFAVAHGVPTPNVERCRYVTTTTESMIVTRKCTFCNSGLPAPKATLGACCLCSQFQSLNRVFLDSVVLTPTLKKAACCSTHIRSTLFLFSICFWHANLSQYI